MKKKFSFLASIALILSILVGTFSPLVASAQNGTTTTNTNVIITKIVSESPTADGSTLSEQTHDGKEITNLREKFGPQAGYLDGATFNVSKISAESYQEWVDNKTTPTDLTETKSHTTADGGKINLNLADGFYWITETETPGVTAQVAASFALALPLMDEDSGTRLASVYLYPKNVTKTVVDKTVTDLEAKTDGFSVGDTIDYWVKAQVPAGNLTKFQLVDTLSSGLKFVNVTAVTTAYVVTNETTDVNVVQAGDQVAVTPTQSGQTATFAFNATDMRQYAGKYVYIKYNAKITKDAEIATYKPNDVKLQYNREGGPDSDIEEKPEENPKVYTGGKKFIKQDPVKKETLVGAEFKIRNADNKFLAQDADGNITWVEEANAKVFISDSEGKFEVKGIDFGATTETLDQASETYYLVETKAPDGYVIPETLRTGLAFIVDQNSYNENETELTVEAATGTLVNNNTKPNIPNTGGIGSVIFVVIGLGLMSAAVYGYKRFAN